MVDLKRKVTVLLLALIFVAGTIALSGCKGEEPPAKKPSPNKTVEKDLE